MSSDVVATPVLDEVVHADLPKDDSVTPTPENNQTEVRQSTPPVDITELDKAGVPGAISSRENESGSSPPECIPSEPPLIQGEKVDEQNEEPGLATETSSLEQSIDQPPLDTEGTSDGSVAQDGTSHIETTTADPAPLEEQHKDMVASLVDKAPTMSDDASEIPSEPLSQTNEQLKEQHHDQQEAQRQDQQEGQHLGQELPLSHQQDEQSQQVTLESNSNDEDEKKKKKKAKVNESFASEEQLEKIKTFLVEKIQENECSQQASEIQRYVEGELNEKQRRRYLPPLLQSISKFFDEKGEGGGEHDIELEVQSSICLLEQLFLSMGRTSPLQDMYTAEEEEMLDLLFHSTTPQSTPRATEIVSS